MNMTPKEFLEKQGYTETVTYPDKAVKSPTFQWSTVLRLLEEYAASLTGDQADKSDLGVYENHVRETTVASPSEPLREALEKRTLQEIVDLCDISIFYCDKYLQLGVTEFNSFKQSLTNIKRKALSTIK